MQGGRFARPAGRPLRRASEDQSGAQANANEDKDDGASGAKVWEEAEWVREAGRGSERASEHVERAGHKSALA